MKQEGTTKKSLTLFGFFAMTASMVMAVYEYPTFATSKLHLVFYLLLGGFLWFIPVALCAAEMATVDGWEKGGVFTWTGKNLGKKYGFANLFFEFFEITVGFVTMIYFILGALSYVFDWPALNSNPMIKFIGVLVIFWILALSQFGGTKYTAKIAKIGFIVGILLPAAILIILALVYIIQGNPIYISSKDTFVPDFTKVNTLVVFVSFILSYMGVEASATHANEMDNPKKEYPLAMLLLVIVAIVVSTLGGLAIAAVIPQDQINLSAGVVQTFAVLLGHFTANNTILVKIIALLLAFGVIAEVSSWVVGPTRGMIIAAEEGAIPKSWAKTNEHDVPVYLVIAQGIIVSIWDAVLTFGAGGSNLSFLAAMSLTVVIYLSGYILFFVGYIKAILGEGLNGAYQMPGGKPVKIIVAIIGLATSIFAFFISFVPPTSIAGNAVQSHEYMWMLIISYVISLILPFAIYDLCQKYMHSHEGNIHHIVVGHKH
ncbi:glutamate:gamma-aminobutyrate antiporter [Clostridium perfringens]|jgi:glutamate:gamma-aminobutyrate antiporter|uniref:glutamate:gamma-aminobutyrate antiporter n=1 Tax=Clostridium perfringens TaxID=1502 RepID=UPI0013E32A59|nr:glutamate:gamma-aminobutyrate antiporter [Clostridium perfringens]EJT5930342.1 glutamate:gamma-aminobutyrate antiporter [Clostridium perfringens]EJT6161605.1 glutamate:gamma-aminobutyrate antiporter [Clostridium perfringens]EJT6504087.1 glutamate:gamma-aminobutyrate antiporter [Clostridium perfringens]ELC8449146.1 glutamate:gamma-aminobutyrate antiporter [Clostridium perfringens]MDK0608463.1 glutamate:gamma-aminobutyrate antiporter [Clostridium perfringens]